MHGDVDGEEKDRDDILREQVRGVSFPLNSAVNVDMYNAVKPWLFLYISSYKL